MKKLLIIPFIFLLLTVNGKSLYSKSDHYPLPKDSIRQYIRYKFIEHHVKKTPPAIQNSVEALTRYLTLPAKNNYEKIRAIYCWVAENIEYDWLGFYDDYYKNTRPSSVLNSKRTICSGFANLIKRMGTLAGIETVKISGFGKGYGYKPGSRLSGVNHAWNAVKIDGHWYLLDSAWGAYFNKEEYFFPSPADFIISHYPVDRKWQLLENTITKNQFRNLYSVKLGDVLLEKGQHEKLKKILDRSLVLIPESSFLKKEKAKFLITEGNGEQAEPLLWESLEKTPDDTETLEALTKLLVNKRQFDKAVEICLNALKYQPENPDIRFYLGRAYIELGEYDKAATEFDFVLKSYPEDEEILLELGNMYFERVQDCVRAEFYYRKLRDLDSYSPKYMKKLGYALICQGRKKEGMKLIEEANANY